MQFHVDCECGKQLAVNRSSAGAMIACTCRRNVEVPSLVQLRRSAGLSRVSVTPDAKVTQLVRKRELPPPTCMGCGNPGTEKIPFLAECESSSAKTSGGFGWGLFLLTLLLPLTILSWKKEQTTIKGRDTIVPVPMSLCYACRGITHCQRLACLAKWLRWGLIAGSLVCLFDDSPYYRWLLGAAAAVFVFEVLLGRWAQSRYKSLLATVPEYQLLLEHYPHAVVVPN